MIIMGGDKKKQMAGLIVSAHLGGPSEPEVEKEEKNEEPEEAIFYAANDIMKAIHAKDVVALKDAMKYFYEMCSSKSEESEESYEPSFED